MNRLFKTTAAIILAGCLLQISMPAQSNPSSSPDPLDAGVGKAQRPERPNPAEGIADLSPEGAGQLGVEGVDEKISDFSPGANQRARKALTPAVAELQSRLTTEKDPLVVQDLHILIKAGNDSIRETELSDKYDIPYTNLSRRLFSGIRAILDEQVSPSRYPAAVVRLKKYAGMEPGL